MGGSSDLRGYLASITEKLKSARVSDISVYYYDLTKDSGFGISEDVQYTPASLCDAPLPGEARNKESKK
jgi:hypothetical protein